MLEEKLVKYLRLWKASLKPFNGRRLVFIHPPKCGGTSITHALRKIAFASNEVIHNSATNSLAKNLVSIGESVTENEIRSKLMLYYCLREVTFISGHLTHLNGYIEEIPDSYDLITVLRNPVDRFISKYYFTRQQLSIDEFVKTEKAKIWGMDYLMRFSGLALEEVLREPQNAYDKSLRNLNSYSIVGKIEKPLSFSSHFKRLYGKAIKIPKFNQNRNEGVDGQQRKKIELLCAYDTALYSQF